MVEGGAPWLLVVDSAAGRGGPGGSVMAVVAGQRGRSEAVDDIAVLERAYDLSGSDSEWLRGLTETVLHGTGWMTGGVIPFDLRDPTIAVPEVVFVGLSEAEQRKAMAAVTMLHESVREMPNSELEFLLMSTKCSTLSSLEMPADPKGRAALARMQDFWFPGDTTGLVARNPEGTGIIFSSILSRPTAFASSYARHWTRLAIHLAAAWRLRRALQRSATAQGPAESDGEAVIDPKTGRVEHATGPARPRTARAALQGAVRAIDKARSRLRREDPLSAVELWQGLVAGRWSLIDRCDSDGRRYYVAHKNEPQLPAPRALSLRERQVVSYVVQGHSNKLIAYELGLDTSTVSNHLRSAQRKLGVRSRTELVRIARLLAQGT